MNRHLLPNSLGVAADGWTAPDRIVSRGRSAGGLLQGAVF
jgi:prolyl oligopeptidase PreP (S9A serine peptidase family)